MKKHRVLAVLSVLGFMFISGLGPAAAKDMVITFWTHEDPNRMEIETRYIEEFEAANPGIKIERVVNSSSKMPELLLTAFAANQGPHIFNTQIEDEYAYIVYGRVAPVDLGAAGYASYDELRDTYIPKVLDPVSVDGKIYGLPLELTNWCPFVNKNVFRSAGLDPDKDYPKTWEEMMSVSEKLVIRDGDILIRRGFDFRYPYYLVSIMPMVEQLGGKLVSDDGTAIINDETSSNFKAIWPNGGRMAKFRIANLYQCEKAL